MSHDDWNKPILFGLDEYGREKYPLPRRYHDSTPDATELMMRRANEEAARVYQEHCERRDAEVADAMLVMSRAGSAYSISADEIARSLSVDGAFVRAMRSAKPPLICKPQKPHRRNMLERIIALYVRLRGGMDFKRKLVALRRAEKFCPDTGFRLYPIATIVWSEGYHARTGCGLGWKVVDLHEVRGRNGCPHAHEWDETGVVSVIPLNSPAEGN